MKCVLAILTVALASQCLSAPVNDEYADLITAVLTYVKQELSAHDPMPLPDVKNERVQEQGVIDLVISQTNTLLSKASTFTVDDVSTDPATLSARVAVTIPEFTQSADYEANGKAFGRAVTGKGTIVVNLLNFYQKVNATFVNPDTSLQIQDLSLDYGLASVDVKCTGLQVEGLTEQEVQDLLNKLVPSIIENQKAKVAAATADVLKAKINPLIAGRTLKEVVAYVESLIHQ